MDTTILAQIEQQAEQVRERVRQVKSDVCALLATDLPAFVMIDEKARRMRDYLSMTQKEIPKEFMESICNISIEYINIQIKNIESAIKIGRRKKISKVETQDQIDAAREWCIKNDISIRK